MENLLEIKNLHATIDGKEILKGINLTVKAGEVHAIMGPNGTGKSTLAKVLMGHYGYEKTSGEINFFGEDISSLEVNERAKRGLFLCMQDPTVIEGVSNSEFLNYLHQVQNLIRLR